MSLPQKYIQACVRGFQILDEQERRAANVYYDQLKNLIQGAVLTRDSEMGIRLLAEVPVPEDSQQRVAFSIARSAARLRFTRLGEPEEDWVRAYATYLRELDKVLARKQAAKKLPWSVALVAYLRLVQGFWQNRDLRASFRGELGNGAAGEMGALTFPTLRCFLGEEWWLDSVIENAQAMFVDPSTPTSESRLVVIDLWLYFVICHAMVSAVSLALCDGAVPQNTYENAVGFLFSYSRTHCFGRLGLRLKTMLALMGDPYSGVSQAGKIDLDLSNLRELSNSYLAEASSWVSALVARDRDAVVRVSSQLLACAAEFE